VASIRCQATSIVNPVLPKLNMVKFSVCSAVNACYPRNEARKVRNQPMLRMTLGLAILTLKLAVKDCHHLSVKQV
jgi:hypothetical protein